MKFKRETIEKVIQELDVLMTIMKQAEQEALERMESVHPQYRKSAQNLIHYNAFRTVDMTAIQKKLRNMGLTRFANAEAHIMPSVVTTRYVLGQLLGDGNADTLKKTGSIKKGRRLLNRNTKELLGYRSKGRRVRIMVTQPTEAAHNYNIVEEMVREGMNCARINCAHDTPEVWKKIIANVQKASKSLGKKVKIAMDLAGPKIRTGQLPEGPKIKRFKPKKDSSGKIVLPVDILLVSEDHRLLEKNKLPIKEFNPNAFKVGDLLTTVDARGKHRQLSVERVIGEEVIVRSEKSIYMETGMILNKVSDTGFYGFAIGELPTVNEHLLLNVGDSIEISRNSEIGYPAVYNDDGKLIKKTRIACQMPEVFEYINKGERVLFDDGKIGGVISSVTDTFFTVDITMAKMNRSKLRAYKGINFPDSTLGFSGLTEKDRGDLPFVSTHADIINFSFVNRAEDVRELYHELEKLDALEKLDVVLKIETKYAFDNLVEILLEAMGHQHVGVMIARGDLAIETGWENIGRIQHEILSLCGAAHIPVIWATQVLENLAKTGLPSRSEITDAVNSLKAECVMLNKGPFIGEAIGLLHTILSKMEPSQNKNEPMLPKIKT